MDKRLLFRDSLLSCENRQEELEVINSAISGVYTGTEHNDIGAVYAEVNQFALWWSIDEDGEIVDSEDSSNA